MQKIFKKYRPAFIGVAVGALMGFAYWYFIGCTESCVIASSPVNSTIWGAAMGGLIGNLFHRKEQPKKEKRA